jgi:hypothetical protein
VRADRHTVRDMTPTPALLALLHAIAPVVGFVRSWGVRLLCHPWATLLADSALLLLALCNKGAPPPGPADFRVAWPVLCRLARVWPWSRERPRR